MYEHIFGTRQKHEFGDEYEKSAVEAEKLNSILEAGRIAPPAANMQPCRFLVLNDEAAMSKLQKACTPHEAPLAIVVYADKKAAWVRPFDKASMTDIDTSIAGRPDDDVRSGHGAFKLLDYLF